MSFSTRFSIHRLTPDDETLMEALLATFGEAFDEVEAYGGNRPSPQISAVEYKNSLK